MKTRRLNASALLLNPGADKFVQAYTTQTPAAARGAFVDVKGRTVAVYDRVRLDAERSVLVVAASVRERLKTHLKTYLFLTDAALTELPHAVGWDLEPSLGVPAEDGWRVTRSAGAIRIVEGAIEDTVSDEEFRLFRVRNGLPLQGEDYDDTMLLNLNDPDLVSFTKGCYLGQEIIARVHYRGRPPLKLTPVRESECPADLKGRMTSRVWDPEVGEHRGFVFLSTPARV